MSYRAEIEEINRVMLLQDQQARQLASLSRLPKSTEQEREIRRLRASETALEPFAAEYERLAETLKALPLDAKPFSGLDITVGNLKAAYDACRRRAGV